MFLLEHYKATAVLRDYEINSCWYVRVTGKINGGSYLDRILFLQGRIITKKSVCACMYECV